MRWWMFTLGVVLALSPLAAYIGDTLSPRPVISGLYDLALALGGLGVIAIASAPNLPLTARVTILFLGLLALALQFAFAATVELPH